MNRIHSERVILQRVCCKTKADEGVGDWITFSILTSGMRCNVQGITLVEVQVQAGRIAITGRISRFLTDVPPDASRLRIDWIARADLWKVLPNECRRFGIQ